MTGKTAILGFIAGVSIGAIAGILFSPDKGSDTRRKIADKAGDFGNTLKDRLTNFIKSGQTPAEEKTDSSGMTLNTMG